MFDLFERVILYILSYILKYIPGAKEACNKEVRRKLRSLAFVFDQAVRRRPRKHFSNDLKDQGICEWVVYKNPRMLEYVPDDFKTREIWDNAMMEDPYSLQLVSD